MSLRSLEVAGLAEAGAAISCGSGVPGAGLGKRAARRGVSSRLLAAATPPLACLQCSPVPPPWRSWLILAGALVLELRPGACHLERKVLCALGEGLPRIRRPGTRVRGASRGAKGYLASSLPTQSAQLAKGCASPRAPAEGAIGTPRTEPGWGPGRCSFQAGLGRRRAGTKRKGGGVSG